MLSIHKQPLQIRVYKKFEIIRFLSMGLEGGDGEIGYTDTIDLRKPDDFKYYARKFKPFNTELHPSLYQLELIHLYISDFLDSKYTLLHPIEFKAMLHPAFRKYNRIRFSMKNENYATINPFECKNLFTDLGKIALDLPNPQLFQFVSKYGLPMGTGIGTHSSDAVFYSASLLDFYFPLCDYLMLYELLVHLQEEQEGWKRWKQAWIKHFHSLSIFAPRIEDIHTETDAKAFLYEEVFQKQREVREEVIEIKGECILTLHYNDLFSVAYYQLWQHITSKQQLKKCGYCDRYFLQTNPRQKFCPSRSKEERSSCQNNHAMNKYRNKRRANLQMKRESKT